MPDADAAELTFEYPKEPIISYAQTREDVLLWRALHSIKRGFYIDVGAHDPTALSVTRAFYDRGWHGINVEPNPSYGAKLRKERPRDVTLEVALGHSPGMAAFYEFGDTGLSTMVKEIADGHIAAGFKAAEQRVPVTTLAAVTDDLGDQEVHFLKIDVEGYERQVLRGANLEKVRPWIVLIEAVRPMTLIPSYGSWEPLLLEAGYKFVYFDGLNRFYVAEEQFGLERYFSVPVSICDPFRDSQVVRLSDSVAELEREKVQRADLVARLSEVVADLERERVTQASEAARLSEVVADLERDRTTQASEAARLSEVVADLERDRTTQASEAARLSEVVADLERERVTQASEVVRLSAVISELQRDQVRHEVPHLGSSPQMPIACDPGDAAGLLRIVEAQSADLLRLRRALVASRAQAAERLGLLRAASDWRVVSEPSAATQSQGQAAVQEGASPKPLEAPIELARVSEADADFRKVARAIAEEIRQVEEQVRQIVELSRWRRLGQRLGLAKRLDWEQSEWRTKLLTPDTMEASPDSSVADLVSECHRLYGLRAELRMSRWRKVGQYLRLAKRLDWEFEPLDHEPSFAIADYSSGVTPMPEAAVAIAASVVQAPQVPALTSTSYEAFLEHTRGRFLDECRSFAIDVVLDVGANIGQFAQGIRAAGYRGHIVSFEPLSAAHEALTEAAAEDPLWDVVERCAVGDREGSGVINIAGNSYSSSLLPMLRLHREAAPQSAYTGTEDCPVITLDAYIGRTFSDPTIGIGLKIDTQGYEAQVLTGLHRYRDRVKVILCEMSLSPLYAGAPSAAELCHLLAALGYQCVALGPEFEDPRTGELLQVDGVFTIRQ
jgi:FkbM family methyltransferase